MDEETASKIRSAYTQVLKEHAHLFEVPKRKRVCVCPRCLGAGVVGTEKCPICEDT